MLPESTWLGLCTIRCTTTRTNVTWLCRAEDQNGLDVVTEIDSEEWMVDGFPKE
jgi:hypothetical protein